MRLSHFFVNCSSIFLNCKNRRTAYLRTPSMHFFIFLIILKKQTSLPIVCLCVLPCMGKSTVHLIVKKNSSRNVELALQAFQQDNSITTTKEKLFEEFKDFVKETRWFRQLKENNFYSFWHKFVHEIVAYHYGQNHVDGLLAVMGSNFISEKIRLDKGININTDELFLYVDVSKLEKRLFNDIHYYINYLHVFTNDCWKNISFCNAFRSELQRMDRSDIDDLFWKCQNEIFFQVYIQLGYPRGRKQVTYLSKMMIPNGFVTSFSKIELKRLAKIGLSIKRKSRLSAGFKGLVSIKFFLNYSLINGMLRK